MGSVCGAVMVSRTFWAGAVAKRWMVTPWVLPVTVATVVAVPAASTSSSVKSRVFQATFSPPADAGAGAPLRRQGAVAGALRRLIGGAAGAGRGAHEQGEVLLGRAEGDRCVQGVERCGLARGIGAVERPAPAQAQLILTVAVGVPDPVGVVLDEHAQRRVAGARLELAEVA